MSAAAAQQQDRDTEITVYQSYVTDLKSEVDYLREALDWKDIIILRQLKELEEMRRPWWRRK